MHTATDKYYSILCHFKSLALKQLQPDVYFGARLGDRVAISRNDVRDYEKELKNTLVQWVNDDSMTEVS